MKCLKNQKYPFAQALLDELEARFSASQHIIFAARNDTRMIEFTPKGGEPIKLAVKSFRVPHLLNRFVYRFIRASKAKRSYLHSVKIGDLTPEAVACCEQFKNGLLGKSYYICHYFDFDFEIKEVLTDADYQNRDDILRQFADFTYQLHEKGIYHKDYSSKNILVKCSDSDYEFKIVDVNRMNFGELNIAKRMQNFSRLALDDATMTIIIQRYAEILGVEHSPLLKQAMAARDTFRSRRKRLRKIRGKD